MEPSCAEERIDFLLETYGTTILRIAYTYVKNLQDAEDVVQETFLKYLEHLPKFESSAHEKAWLLRVAINISKNKCKSAWSRLRVDHEEVFTIQGTKEVGYEQVEWKSEVLQAVLSLPLKYRAVIHLYYYEDYSIQEIATCLGKNKNTIKSLLNRGRERLKRTLEEEYDYA